MDVAKHRISFPLFAILLITVLIVSACPPPAPEVEPEATPELSPAEIERRQTVIFDIDGGRVASPELWNPYVPGNRRDQGFHQAIIEPIFILNYESGEIEPWLGESMVANETMDVWTLTLRDGIRWSDGEPLTADDLVFTIQLLLDNSPELLRSAPLANTIASVEKTDDLTVVFNLSEPNPRFQLDHFAVKIFDGVYILPEHIWHDKDPLTFTNYDPEQGWPLFTGPYKLISVSDTEFIYERDDNWWGAQTGFMPLPQPKTLIWTWPGPEETRAALMADRQMDSLQDITLGAYEALEQRNPNVITWFDELPYVWFGPCTRTFELNHTVEPWDDKDMRWALNYAINRDEVVAIAYEGTTSPARHFFPAYAPLEHYVDLLIEVGLYDEYPITRHDSELAQEIIESKGWELGADGYYYKDGEQLVLDIQTHEAFIEKQRIGDVVVEHLQRIGINASRRTLAGGTWSENFDFGNYDARLGWQTCGSVNEPWASMDTFNTRWLTPVGERTGSGQNAWRWSGEPADAYSALVDQIGLLPLGDPQIEELFVEAMEVWMDELPVIPVTYATKLIPFDNTYWTNWPTAENNYLQPTTWWNNTHKVIHMLEPAE